MLYHTLEGYLDGSWGDRYDIPEFTSIWKRIGKTMPRFDADSISCTIKGRTLRVAIDSTGITLHDRGEWIRTKWNVKRGFLKMHLLIDLDTQRIISFSMTDMNGGDAGQIPMLLNKLLKKYTGENLPLTGQLAEIVADSTSDGTTSTRAAPNQKLPSEWMYETTSRQGAPVEKEKAPVEKEKAPKDEESLEDLSAILDDELLEMCQLLKRMGITIEMRGDGGYDTRKIFAFLAKLNIVS